MCFSTMVENVGMAQEVQQVIQQSDGWWFDSWMLLSACHSIFVQNTEPQVAPNMFTGVWMCMTESSYT